MERIQKNCQELLTATREALGPMFTSIFEFIIDHIDVLQKGKSNQ